MNPKSSTIINLEDDLYLNIDKSELSDSFLKGMPYLSPDKYMTLTQLLQMNFNINTAYLIITFSDCKSITEALDFITTDDDGYYNHPFIERENKEKNCMLCDSTNQMHLDVIQGNNPNLSKL